MKTYSGSTSEGFNPITLSGNTPAATALAPTPEDPSATFADLLQQEQGDNAVTDTTFAASLLNSATPTASSAAALTTPVTPGSTPPAAAFFAPMSRTVSLAWLAGATPRVPAAPAASGTKENSSVPTSDPTAVETTSTRFTPPRDAWFVRSEAPMTTPTGSTPKPLTSSDDAPSEDAATTTPSFTPPTFSKTSTLTPFFNADPAKDKADADETTPPSAASLPAASSSPAFDPGTTNTALSFFLASQTARPAPLPTPSVTPAPDAPSATGAEPDVSVENEPASTLALTSAPLSTPAPLPTPGARTLLSGAPMTTHMVHAAVLAAHSRNNTASGQTAADPGNGVAASLTVLSNANILLQGVGKQAPSPLSTEKKSGAGASERSFIQTGTPAATGADVPPLLASILAQVNSQASVSQAITSTESSAKKAVGGISSPALNPAGTTNDKKGSDMNATLDLAPTITSTGTNPLVSRAPADVHILLGTNNDFNEAIDHIMHVADLSNLSRTTNPLRVAIEIQTPPGAIVNVYVSRQADSSYRAQLGTNDVQALGWVQDQIGSLKTSTSTGTDIRWAPAQLESGTASLGSPSTGGDRDLDWNRGGNGGYDQRENRPSRIPQEDASDEDDSPLGIPFFETLGAMGGAA